MDAHEFFYRLTPDVVLDAAERAGFTPTGTHMQLNSLENRVFRVDREEGVPLVLKFYRPGRWSRETILEEHEFLSDCLAADIPVCAPIALPDGGTLMETDGIFWAVWERAAGKIPDEFSDRTLGMVGRAVARIHEMGASKAAPHRPVLTAETFLREPLQYILSESLIPGQFAPRYRKATLEAAEALDRSLEGVPVHRIHGDCHWGNLLLDASGTLRFLDFDDFRIGPAAQDIWMIAPAVDARGMEQRALLLAAYREIRPFEDRWLDAVNPLRAARFVHYAAWIAHRRDDPAFRQAFPDFGTEEYWETETRDLENLVRDGFSPALLPNRPSDKELEDISRLTKKDYFWDLE